MDELEELYKKLYAAGKTTKSFDEFQSQYNQNTEYKNKVLEVSYRDGFLKRETPANPIVNKEKVSKASPSADGSLVSKGKTPEFKFQQPSVIPQRSTINVATNKVEPYVAPKQPEVKKEPTEEDYFTGAFGNVLRKVDEISPIGIGDFIDDIGRSVASGYRQGKFAEEADKLLLKGTKATPEQIQKFIDANKEAAKLGPSAEMQEYQKIYEKEGKGFWGVVKGLFNNPSVIPQVAYSSITSMATNRDALLAAGSAIGTGASGGAAIGSAFGGVGAIPGAIAGAEAAIPYAFGLASTVVETGATFGELLNEELDGKEMTKENVKAILENPEKYKSIRNKAIARGIIIGTADALTNKLASGVGAKILSKSAAKSAVGSATKGAVTKATAAGAAVEGLGGSAGEAAARGAIGQDMDMSEIALEGLAELPGGIRSTIQARLAKPSYKVNGEKVSAEQVDDLITTMTPDELAKTKIEIKNDYAGREFKIRDKIITDNIKKQIKQANPELNEASLNAVTDLEKQLNALEGNKTQTGKDKAAAIRSQIKDIQENQLQEEAVEETVETQLKPKEDAIQKQTTGQVPVQSETGVSETLETRAPETGLEITTEKTISTAQPQEKIIEENLNIGDTITGDIFGEKVTGTVTNVGINKGQIVVDITDQNGNNRFLYGENIESIEPKAKEIENLTPNQKQRQIELLNKEELTEDEIEELDILGKIKRGEITKQIEEVSSKTQEEAPKISAKEILNTFEKGSVIDVNEILELSKGEDNIINNVLSKMKNNFNKIKISGKRPNEGAAFYNYNNKEIDINKNSVFWDNVDGYTTAGTIAHEYTHHLIEESNNKNEIEKSLQEIKDDLKNNPPDINDKNKSLYDFMVSENNSPQEILTYAVSDATIRPILAKYKDKLNTISNKVIGEDVITDADVEKSKQNETEQLQPERTGDGGRRTESRSITPLKDAPSVKGFYGPIPEVVSVAEQYAADNGIDLKRQAEYVEVDVERAKRIADEYAKMEHNPQDPKVKEAYQNLIKQTLAQYNALVNAGYKFWFIDINNPSNAEYASSPYNALRDLRENKEMGVFPTTEGFGTTEFDPDKNPLLEDTGIMWAVGGPNGKLAPVLANDLFRAVHDAFGHGLEGAGFRARGEENAWQAHVRLFTGSAIGAITSETRGQNSWLNFGPFGDNNRNAKVEDTVFADQKTGLMPEWTWTEGRAKDMEVEAETPTVSAATQGLSEAELPGYNRMINEVEGIVSKSKNRGVSEPKIAENVMNYVTGSKVYENATDVQREALVREVNKRFGIKEKAAPSANRILGKLKDITKITMSEKVALAKQIKDTARGAKEAVKAWKNASQQLTKEIKELVSTGKVNAKQVALVLRKFSSVNVFDDNSVDRFVEYMSKVFGDAEYANKIDIARNKLSNARKNIATKIGIADGLMLPLQRLFSINPSLIPDASLNSYLELLDMFGEKKAVLSLSEKQSTIKKVQDILQEIDEEQSLADELADRFEYSENKVFDEDGKLDYSASIKAMLKANEITQDEADLMKKYKSDIIPQVEKSKATDEEIQKEKKELINLIKSTEISSSDLPTKDEKGLANQLKKLIGTNAINSLTNTELKNLFKVIDNINNGYLPHYAQLLVEKMNASNNSVVYENAINTAKPLSISKFYSKIKSLLTRKGAIDEMVRRSPLFYIDQLFGDFKSKNIFNSLFKESAEAVASFKAELKNVQSILEKAEERVAKSFKLNPDKTLMSKFKMMTYMIQLEYESNEGNKQVNPAAEYLKATIKHIDAGKSQFGERDANMLQKILDDYGKVVGKDSNGKDIIEIDLEKLNKSFNSAEKQAIKDIRGINESLTEKAEYTATIIRGQKLNPLNNYVHLNVLSESKPNDIMEGGSFADIYNQSLNPSTKAKSLIERTRGAKPLNFDIFTSAQKGAKFTLMDYHLTEPIRTARKTINQTTKNMEDKGRIPKEKRQILNSINSAYEETVSNLITNSYVSSTFADDVIDFIGKQGYRAVLAGTGRFISELVSNTGYALISNPKAAATGLKYKGFIMSTDAPLVLQNVNSKQTNRIFPNDTLSGNMIDQNILSQYGGIKSAKSKNPVHNKIQQIWNLTGKKYKNAVELISDTLISTPDKMVMRPLWFGSFANEFKNETGVDIDFEKIAANDEAYMSKYKDAIENAKTKADEVSVMAGATDNPFMGILKGTVQPNQGFAARAFNNFNNYMTRFLIFEFVTARTGIMAAMGNGSLSRKEGAAVLAGVTTRMVTYTLLTQLLGAGLMEIFSEDDEQEDEKSILQKLGQAIASGASSLILGRDFGNATKLLINYGIEKVNEEYLDFLREGEYDPYKDAIAFSLIPQGKKAQQTDFSDLLMKMGGSFGPALNTTELLIRKLTSPPKEDEAAIERSEAENKVRLPLELLGVTGFVPLYKDIRKVVMKNMYKDLKNAEANAENKKVIEQEKLSGYKNKEELKRYAPEIYEQNFGEGSPGYDVDEAKRKLKREQDSIERALKDELYNYQPRKKGGFGSAGFGEKSKRKSSGGFGSSKFGGN